MDTLALQLKSHESRFEACNEIMTLIRNGKFSMDKREEIMEVLKEPWVEQHDTVARLTYFAILANYPEYLKNNYSILLNDIKPFIYEYFTPKQLPLYRNAAVSIVLEMIKTLTMHCKWRQGDVELKILNSHLRSIMDKTGAEYDLISSVRIGFLLFDLGFEQLVTKFYGSQVERKLDLIMNESLVRYLIRDSVLRLSCDPLLKQVLVVLSQLEKQNETSKKMWKAFFELGNSKNMAYRALFFEILVSFVALNQNKRIFMKILKTKAMRSLVRNMDNIQSTSPYYANLIEKLSHAFARLNENPRFRKVIFPPAEDYREEYADISKMVIFASGSSKKIFDFITELPEPFPQAFLLNINNVDPSSLSEEFLKGLFDFAFIQTLSDEDFEELENEGATLENGNQQNDEDDDDELAAGQQKGDSDEADDDILLSDLIVDQDSLVEEAQMVLLKTVNRCATWHHASLISSIADHYQTKLHLDENSREVLQTVFPEAESKLRDALFALRNRLQSLDVSQEMEDRRKALTVFVEALLLHQLYIPSLLTTESQVVEDLDNFVAVVFEGEENDKEVNPVEVLVDLTLQLVTIDNLLSPAAGFCIKYFLRGNVNEDIINMFLSVVQPALSGDEGDEIFDPNMMVPEDVLEEDEEDAEDLMALQDQMDTSDDEEGLATERMVNALASGEVNIEGADDFDQDEYMFQHDDQLRDMFLERKRDLEQQKSALIEARESAFTAASGVLELVEIFLRHTYSAEDALKIFVSFLKVYVSRLKNSAPKKFAAQTHQKVLHVLSVIYKTPLAFSTDVEERKKTKGTTHKYYGRIDNLVQPLVSQFFALLACSHKIPSTQMQPLLQFFNTIFSQHPDKDTLIAPLVRAKLNKKVVIVSKFSSTKVVSFLVSLPWMAEYIGEMLIPVVKKFSKRATEVFRFLETTLDKKWNIFAKEGSFDEFIRVCVEALKADIQAGRKKKLEKNKMLMTYTRNVLRRIYSKQPSTLSEETKTNIVELATQLNTLRPQVWAPILDTKTEQQQRKRDKKRKRDRMEKSEVSASEGEFSKQTNFKALEREKKRQRREAAEKRKEKLNGDLAA
eukprot:CAMPEP_0117436228 /NCGR_PEP_ID=MMETSP0759-20121206/898_1 /TAXON_ID=63605 /ORGANISM="Percolomonas cosmopolitus, Strain WS" /LENGTH=1077 /DNA_ID=CAMNT_0005227819 /DNA_START=62 /DNA_END=3295 /DNA_ORIENTATION=-